jgi:hypothetical protein
VTNLLTKWQLGVCEFSTSFGTMSGAADIYRAETADGTLALVSYNAGESTVARHGRRIPPYNVTMLYVPAVLIKLQTARNTPAP